VVLREYDGERNVLQPDPRSPALGSSALRALFEVITPEAPEGLFATTRPDAVSIGNVIAMIRNRMKR
jgi:hypothetical protein